MLSALKVCVTVYRYSVTIAALIMYFNLYILYYVHSLNIVCDTPRANGVMLLKMGILKCNEELIIEYIASLKYNCFLSAFIMIKKLRLLITKFEVFTCE